MKKSELGGEPSRQQQVSTGIPGLDHILNGGLPQGRPYLIQGNPGSGKTTIGLQFLLAGIAAGERVMYIAASDAEDEVRSAALSHGWSLKGLDIIEVDSIANQKREPQQHTIFHPAEIELAEAMEAVVGELNRVRPTRVVFDSLSELRLLAAEPLRYRRHLLSLKQHLDSLQATSLLLEDSLATATEMQLQSPMHGVIQLEQIAPEYGTDRRRLRILKVRGHRYHHGYHDFSIGVGGVVVYPRLVAAETRTDFPHEAVSTGLPKLDQLLGGGIDRGTSTLFIGPAGVGKSTIAAKCMAAAAARGERGSIFIFDEQMQTFIRRSETLGLSMKQYIADGIVTLRQVDPAELSPGEFAHAVRESVEEFGAKYVLIDSLTGYLNAMAADRLLPLQLHELLSYLGQHGVATFLVYGQHGFVSVEGRAAVDLSYLSDTVVLLRYFEAEGEIRQCISVFKRRSGNHEHKIRDLQLANGEIVLAEVLRNYSGVLTGVPKVLGNPAENEMYG